MSSSHSRVRKQLGLWILNGSYITEKERGQPSQDVQLPHLLISSNELTRDFLKTFGNAKQSDFAKLKYLIYDLEHCCHLEWELKQSKMGRKIKGCNFPKFQLKRWESLPSSGKLMMSGFICLHLEGLFPSTLVKLVADIIAKETWPDNPPLIEAYELCELPTHYLLSFLIFLRHVGLEEDMATPGKEQIIKIWHALNIDYLVDSFHRKEPQLNRSTSMEMTEPMIEEITEHAEGNRELVSVFCLSVLVRLGVAKYFIHNLDDEYKGRGAASPSYDPSMLVNMLRSARMNFEVLSRLVKANASSSETTPAQSQGQSEEVSQLHSMQTTDPNAKRVSVTIDPFVSDVYPVSHFYKKPMSFSSVSESNDAENVSSIKLVPDDFRSPGLSLYIGTSTQTTGRKNTNSDFRLKKKAVPQGARPFRKEALPNVLRPSASYVTPAKSSRSSSFASKSNAPIVKRELNIPSHMVSNGKNPEIYSADNADKPKFIMSSASKLPRTETDWRSMQEPPPVYFKSPPNHASVAVSSLLKSKTSSLFRASQCSFKTGTDTLNSPRSQVEEAKKKASEGTFITSVAMMTKRTEEEPQEEMKSSDTIQLPTPEWTSVSGNEAKERVKKEVRWFGVPQKVQCLVTEDNSEYLKTSNFYEEHRDQLYTYIPKRKRSKLKLGVFGRTASHTTIQHPIIKDSQHYLRVYNNEGIPWAQHSLVPKLKIRQDTFCQNYGELLRHDLKLINSMMPELQDLWSKLGG
mmetsp:Transcript_19118/g.34798  ORF Transcript_19118/g.34798 Transcript_19118/m.34798 type:complete len:744 (-) Transcript_19118:1430-3661(-)